MSPLARAALVLAVSAAGASGAVAQNLHPAGDFNDVDGVDGWNMVTGTAEFQTADASNCPASGSLRGVGDDNPPLPSFLNLEGPCIPIEDNDGQVYVSFAYQGSGGALPGSVSYALESYSDALCNVLFDEVGFETFEIFPWQRFSGSVPIQKSGAVRMRLTGGCDGPCLAEIDEIRVTLQPHVFLEDFEGGGTCRWSSAVS